MRRVLFVGDVHAVPSELGDCQALIDYVLLTAKEQAAEAFFLGDQYHSHQIIRSEVMNFWRASFKAFKTAHVAVSALVGNHDVSGEGNSIHAMAAHEEQIDVIDRPVVHKNVLYLPYYSDKAAFVAACKAYPTRMVVCHQTFMGAQFENGMYAPEGVEPADIPQAEVLSGHIHKPSTFDKVTYIGAPRWRSLSDANMERAIWLFTFDDNGNVVGKEPFDTGKVCRQIRYAEVTPENPFNLVPDPNVDWRIDIRGPADFVQAQKEALQIPGAKVRTFKTDTKKIAVKESEGIPAALHSYLGKYTPRHGTSKETLATMLRERLGI
jgi:DNA repair exonuclease SbcCD nuclease subunit